MNSLMRKISLFKFEIFAKQYMKKETPKMENKFLEKAQKINIELKEKVVSPKYLCEIVKDDKYYKGWGTEPIKEYTGTDSLVWGTLCYDFGEHYVGYLSFDIDSSGEICVSPVRLKITFAEVPFEFSYDGQKPGWLSYSWIQEEIINIDVVPGRVTLPRRYACRYVKIEVVEKNKNMLLIFNNVEFKAVSSAGFDLNCQVKDEKFRKIAEVSTRTLRDCMQLVYEDGPKRDRRLWLGDIRLQALVNYATFGDTDLVKRCLYLFAGLISEEGKVPSCLYISPKPKDGEIYLADYCMILMACLWDWWEFTGDVKLCEELFDVALSQFRIILKERLLPDGTIRDDDSWWIFIDWDDYNLPKSLAASAEFAYFLTYAIKMSELLGRKEELKEAENYYKIITESAKEHYFNSDKGLFEEDGKVCWNTNCFMILSGALSKEEGISIMKKLRASEDALVPVTPYVYHYVAQSYADLGMKDELEELIFDYWGDMIENGADTFWESYKKDDPFFSPYDDAVLVSACHAWSCTPMYFIKKYFE